MPDYAKDYAAPGAAGAFPGTGSTASDDSLSGVSAALGVLPIAFGTAPEHGPFKAGYNQGPPQLVTKTINQMILDLAKMPHPQQAVIQNALLQAGYYGANPPVVVPGEINAADRAAYRAAVEDAARATEYDQTTHAITKPVTVQQVIADRIANRQAQGTPLTAAQQVNVTSPDDIRAAVQASARQQYGKKADPALVAHVIAQYQQLQEQAARSTAPNVVQPPNVSNFADAQVQAANPTLVGVNNKLGIADAVMRIFQQPLGSSSQGITG